MNAAIPERRPVKEEISGLIIGSHIKSGFHRMKQTFSRDDSTMWQKDYPSQKIKKRPPQKARRECDPQGSTPMKISKMAQ
jgi:hypothetical protein